MRFEVDITDIENERLGHFLDAGVEPDIEGQQAAMDLLYSNLSPEQEEIKRQIEDWQAEGGA